MLLTRMLRCFFATITGYLLVIAFADAQETCGLQEAEYVSGVLPLPGPIQPGLGPALSTVSAPTLGVTPTITITSPLSGAILSEGRVQIAGTVNGSPNTGVSVNGLRAYVHNGTFLTPEMRIDEAATTIEAQATAMDGLTATANLSVRVCGVQPSWAVTDWIVAHSEG